MIYRRIASRDEFERTVELGQTPETKHVEFKGGYGWRGTSKDEQAVELCRDIAQFANTDGACCSSELQKRKPRTAVSRPQLWPPAFRLPLARHAVSNAD